MALWLTILSSLSLLVAIACSLIIAYDIFAKVHRQKMGIMNFVWPTTALYLSLFGLWAYWNMARPMSKISHDISGPSSSAQPADMAEREKTASEVSTPNAHGEKTMQHVERKQSQHPDNLDHSSSSSMSMSSMPEMPISFPKRIFVSATHCGAGCEIGDFIGAWAVFLLVSGVVIITSRLLAEYAVDFVLAYALGILFQYIPITTDRHLKPLEGLKEAVKADTLSLAAFEIGLFGWMAFFIFVLFRGSPPSVDNVVYWFMMQIGMFAGHFTSYPANWFLVKKGIKRGM